MKKLFIFALAAIGLLACAEKNAPDEGAGNGGSTNPKEISCEPSVIEFDVAQNITSTITLTANGSWSATANVDWITIEPSSGQGSSYVKIKAKKGKPAEGKALFSTEKASAQILVKRIDKYPGSFSVSENKKVYFSKGNLQYQASTKTWRFAEHQYDIIGEGNKYISSTYTGWIDLFGWGTSGYMYNYPWLSIQDNASYSCLGEYKDIDGSNYDWGVYNAISNGGNQAGIWRTLTKAEWGYLLSSSVSATINGVKGCLLLPDGWITPSGLNVISQKKIWGESNNYTLSQWKILEETGAVFLPCGGYRSATEIYSVGEMGLYWSTTNNGAKDAFVLRFDSKCWAQTYIDYRYNGHSVRLVKDMQ